MERIVLAYSGGLDTSVAIPWLAEQYGAEVIAVTMDLGQGRELEEVRDRALAAGAVRAHVLDVREEFARDYILPALKADALYEDRYPLATALGRPLIARKLVEIAAIEQATAIAHGCTGKGNDQVRLDVATRALNPAIKVIAPARDWGMTRPEEIEYARARGIPVPATVDSPYSTDANLWGRSIECGVLEDPWTEPPEEIYTLTRPPAECPDEPAYVEMTFERGVPDRHQRRRDAARRAHRQPRHDRRRARRRPHRHGREPARRHQVARDLRGAGRRRAARGAPGAADASSRTKDRGSLFALREPAVRRPRVQRPLVHAAARGARRVRRRRSRSG